MYNEITVDRSLLYIDQHHVDTFKSLAKKMSQFNFIIEDGGLRKKDAWVIAFNTWLMLLPDKYNLSNLLKRQFTILLILLFIKR